MSRNTLQDAASDDLTLAPPARRRFGRKFRLLWGHGVFSGLPLAEVVLLAAFIASASLFFTIQDNGTVTKTKAPVEVQSESQID